ncbi:MAG TPA: hypothetical protein PLJ26_01370 [Candidatus Omnitrophota bacterium]|nr:hypothetical protein [Candidatus Omnitrophota bacterium]
MPASTETLRRVRKAIAVAMSAAFFVDSIAVPGYAAGNNLRPVSAKQSNSRLHSLGQDLGISRLSLLKDGGKPVNVKREVETLMQRLKAERMNERLESADSDFAAWGYEEDGVTSRLGWTVRNAQAILDDLARADEYVPWQATGLKNLMLVNRFKYAVFCGMGGSGLSVELVKQTFDPDSEGTPFYSLRTTDPAAIKAILDEIARAEGNDMKAGLEKTVAVFMSKTATTQETTEHEKYFRKLFEAYAVSGPEKHLFYVTDPGSPWDGDHVKKGQGAYIQMNDVNPGKVYNLKDVGGRFTAPTTNIFMLPWSLTPGADDIEPILKSAVRMNSGLSEGDFLKMGAEIFVRARNLKQDKLTMLVPKKLNALPMWAEQLFEESLGKDGKGVTVFYGEDLGTDNDQWKASLKPADENDRVFLRINLGATETNREFWKYLQENGYPTLEINIKDITDIGGVMLGLQRMVATIGYLWDIRFVNQPGVEAYKKESKAIAQAMKDSGQTKQDVLAAWAPFSADYLNAFTLYYAPLVMSGIITADALDAQVRRMGADMQNAAAVYAAITQILEQKAKAGETEFNAAELSSYGKLSPAMTRILEDARRDIFTRGLRIPSKLGEGPDKNHSYQQNIQDGRNMFFSTYFTSLNNPQPAVPFDDNLLFAQTIGTVKAMYTSLDPRKAVLFVAEQMTPEVESAYADFFSKVKAYLDLARVRDAADSLVGKAAAFIEDADRNVYSATSFMYEGIIKGVREIEGIEGALVIGANTIFENAGSIAALTQARDAANVLTIAVWARNNDDVAALKALGVDKIATIYTGLGETLMAMEKLKISPRKVVLINSDLDLDNIKDEYKVPDASVFFNNNRELQMVHVSTARTAGAVKQINAVPLAIAKAIAIIFDVGTTRAQFAKMVQAFKDRGMISEADAKSLNELTAQISDIPLVAVSDDIARLQVIFEDTLNKI